MKIPKIKKDESLAAWRERLAQEFNLDDRMQEIIREVSVTSYIHGTNVTLEILKQKEREAKRGEILTDGEMYEQAKKHYL